MVQSVKIYDVAMSKDGYFNWKIGLGVGVALAGGGLFWWYFKSSSPTVEVKETKPNSQQNGLTEQSVASKSQQGKKNENGVKETPKFQTPLQRAEQIKMAGNEFFKRGEYLDAIRCYSEAIELCPTSEANILSTYYQNRAACYDHLNKLEEVVKDCSAALKLNPKYTKALSRRAKAYQTLGQLTQSLEDITAVCILESFQNTKSLEMADSVLKEHGKQLAKKEVATKKPVQPSSHFVRTYFLTFPNDPVINSTDFEVVEINNTKSEDSSVNHLEQAKQLLVRGRYDEAVQKCTEAVKTEEGLELKALLLRATIYLLRGQHSLAMEDLNTIINGEHTPSELNNKIMVNALIKRASLHVQAEDKEKTFEDLATAEKLGPDIPEVYLHRGQMSLLTDLVEESIKNYNECVRLDPNFAVGIMQGYYAEYRRAVTNESSTGIAKVIEKYKRAIRKFPKCSEGYTLLAQLLMDQAQFEEADKYYETAIENDPGNASIRVHKALLQLSWKGDVDTALKLINEGIQIDNRCSFCYETLGTLEVQRLNLKRAVEVFNQAIPLAKTEQELAHIFSLRDAAVAQMVVMERLGLEASP